MDFELLETIGISRDIAESLSADDLAKTETKARRELERRLDAANDYAGVPLRFRRTVFSDSDAPFASEARDFALRKSNDGVLVISGPCGTGKTTLLCAAIHERAVHGMSGGLYMTNRLVSQLVRSTRAFSAKESELELYQRLAGVPFLCMDEAGAAEEPEVEKRFIRTLLAMRYDNMLPTVIATNLNFPELKKFIGDTGGNDPVMDRLNSIIIPRVLGGESRRTQGR